jgi:hypothetical protein
MWVLSVLLFLATFIPMAIMIWEIGRPNPWLTTMLRNGSGSAESEGGWEAGVEYGRRQAPVDPGEAAIRKEMSNARSSAGLKSAAGRREFEEAFLKGFRAGLNEAGRKAR